MSPLRIVRYAFAVAFLAIGTRPATAQQADALVEGQRIRADVHLERVSHLRRLHAQMLTGTLGGVSGDTLILYVRPDVAPLRVPRPAVRTLFVSEGRPNRFESALRSAWLPALAGGALGALSASASGSNDGRSPGEAALRRATTAALVSGVIGALAPKERWRRIWRNPMPAISEATDR